MLPHCATPYLLDGTSCVFKVGSITYNSNTVAAISAVLCNSVKSVDLSQRNRIESYTILKNVVKKRAATE